MTIPALLLCVLLQNKTEAASPFAAKVVAALRQIDETLTKGQGHEACHQRLLSLAGEAGSPVDADVLRALAASFKAAVYCRDCRDGKVVCATCAGKKRTDVKCHVCEGKGRVGAPGAVDKTAVTQKCRNCDGKAVFRDVRCPGCAGAAVNDCTKCLGSPWHDRACLLKACRNGRVPCATCRGKGRLEPKCPACQGRGRVGAPGAIDPTQVTQRCNDCDGKGYFKEKQNCPSCEGSPVGMGFVKCSACGDTRAPVAAVSAVYETERCADGPCARCFGLGLRIRPALIASRKSD